MRTRTWQKQRTGPTQTTTTTAPTDDAKAAETATDNTGTVPASADGAHAARGATTYRIIWDTLAALLRVYQLLVDLSAAARSEQHWFGDSAPRQGQRFARSALRDCARARAVCDASAGQLADTARRRMRGLLCVACLLATYRHFEGPA